MSQLRVMKKNIVALQRTWLYNVSANIPRLELALYIEGGDQGA